MRATALSGILLVAAVLAVAVLLWVTCAANVYDEANAARAAIAPIRMQRAQTLLVHRVRGLEAMVWRAVRPHPADACAVAALLTPEATWVRVVSFNGTAAPVTRGCAPGDANATVMGAVLPFWWGVVTALPPGSSMWVENDLVLHVGGGVCVRVYLSAFHTGGGRGSSCLGLDRVGLHTFYPTPRAAAGGDPDEAVAAVALAVPELLCCDGAGCDPFPPSSRATPLATAVALFNDAFPQRATVYPWPRMRGQLNGLAVGLAVAPETVDATNDTIVWWTVVAACVVVLCVGYLVPMHLAETSMRHATEYFDTLDLSNLPTDIPDLYLPHAGWLTEIADYEIAMHNVLGYIWRVVSYVPAATKRASVGWAHRASAAGVRRLGGSSAGASGRASASAASIGPATGDDMVPTLDISRVQKLRSNATPNMSPLGTDDEATAHLQQLSPYSGSSAEKSATDGTSGTGGGDEVLMEYLLDSGEHSMLSPRSAEDRDRDRDRLNVGPPAGGRRGNRARAMTSNKNRGNQAQLRVKKASLLMVDVGILNNNTNRLEDHEDFSRAVIDCVTACVKRHDGVPVYLNANGILCGWNTHGPQKEHSAQACTAGVSLKQYLNDLVADACPWRIAVSCGTVFAGFSGVHGQMLPVVSGEAASILTQLLTVSDRLRCRLLANATMADKQRVKFTFRIVDIIPALDNSFDAAAGDAALNFDAAAPSPIEEDDDDGQPLSAGRGFPDTSQPPSTPTHRAGREKAVFVYELVGLQQLDVSRSVQTIEKMPPSSYRPYNEGFSALQQRDVDRAIACLTDFLQNFDPRDYQAYRLLQIAHYWRIAPDAAPPRPFTRKHFGWAGYDDEGADYDQFMADVESTAPAADDGEARQQSGSGTSPVHASTAYIDKLKSKIAASAKREAENKAEEGNRLKKDISSAVQANQVQSAGLYMTFTDRKGVKWSRSDQMLGTGAFGEVYKGMSEHGALIAMKILKLPKVQKTPVSRYAHRRKAAGGGGGPSIEQVTEELVNEVNLLTKLRHDNVVAYLASIVSGQFIVICMEFMSGGSLMGLLELFKTLPLHSTMRYLLDILRGLKFLHDNNIIHRDIKPHNVLLHIDGQSKLSDFGASQQLAAIAGKASVQGTPLYMAPEAARGYGSAASDVWSLGITLLELLTGSVPWVFTEEKPFMTHNFIYRLGNDETFHPIIPEDLPPEIDDIVRECLTPSADARPTCDMLLKHPMVRAYAAGRGRQSPGVMPVSPAHHRRSFESIPPTALQPV